MLGHRQWLERGQACTHSWRLAVWTTFADPASFPGLSPQFRKPSFSLPPLHLATLSPRCSLSRQRSRWREGCRQQRGGICLRQSGGAGSPYKEWVGELQTGWRRKEGGGSSLVQVSKRPSTPKASPLTHAFSVLSHSVFFYRVLTTGPDLHQVLGGREPPIKPHQWLQEVSIPGSKANRLDKGGGGG